LEMKKEKEKRLKLQCPFCDAVFEGWNGDELMEHFNEEHKGEIFDEWEDDLKEMIAEFNDLRKKYGEKVNYAFLEWLSDSWRGSKRIAKGLKKKVV